MMWLRPKVIMQGDMTDNLKYPKERKKQALRKRRLGMAFLTYMVPFSLVVLFWVQGMIPFNLVIYYAVYAFLVNFVFLLAFLFNVNLKLSEPSLAAPQMTASIIPALFVMYFLDDGQARAIFLLILAIPLIYGILALNTRQFIKVGGLFLLLYSLMVLRLWWKRPEVLVGPLEAIQIISFALAIVSSSIIGGFINGLRIKIRKRNRELSDAVRTIEALVNVDSLTGVYNRRYLFGMLSQEVMRHRRTKAPFSVCIMDIDHFKQVNDVYGHQAGDEILREVACRVSEGLRSTDFFGRYGGEEFLIILLQTPLEGALVKAEKVRKEIRSLRFPNVSKTLKVTVSIGVAEYRQEEDIDETLSRADKSLYSAKRMGRNRVSAEERE